MRFSIIIFLIALIACPAISHAQVAPDDAPNAQVAALIRQAETRQLAADPHWHALLHYRAQPFGRGLKSGIMSPEFFLSKQGASDPAAELAATLTALFQTPGDDANEHAQCRFIARYQWLRKSLDWSAAIPPTTSCDRFRDWSANGHVTSISLIFATGYLSNPASLYGHLLLKFNTSSNAAGELLDPSMSYGALVPPHESGVVYLYKGLFGGYDAGFSHDKFFRHNHNYAENDLRDMWEYQLALNKAETDEIVAHSWELLRVKFNYYFFSENCASAVAELLSVVVDEPLLPDTPWSIPSTVFNKLTTIKHHDVALVAKVQRIPSRQGRFYEKYFALSATEQQTARLLIDSQLQFEQAQYRRLSPAEKVRTIETLLDYYQFRSADERQLNKYRSARQALLGERLRLPAGESLWPTTQSAPPHAGQPPLLLQSSLVENSTAGTGLELRIRPAYYDFLALDAGRLPNSSLTMFDLRLLYDDQRVRFRSLELLDIETLNLSRTQLPGDGGNAWKIRFGFEQQDLRCEQCTVFSIEGGAGRALQLGDSVVAYGMLEGRAQTTSEDAGSLAASAKLGVALHLAKEWRARFSIGQRAYVNGSRSVDPIIRWENRFGSSRDWDIRLSYEKHKAQEIKASLSLYW
jgi:uncharacterized protein DUF4105